MDEQDRRPVRPAPLADVQPQAAAAPHRVDRSRLRDRCHPCLLVSVGRPDRRRGGAGPHRLGGRILRRRPTYPPAAGCVRAPSAPGSAARYCLDGGFPRARCSSDAYPSSGSSSAPSTRRGRGAARPSWSPGTRASARPGWRPSWRHAPATRGSRPCSGARSTWLARSCRTSRSSRPCARWERSRRSMGRRRARSCACSRRRWRCCTTARPPRRCCWCSRTCTGPTPPRSTWSSSSPTTSATSGCCCWRPTARTSPPRPRGCAGWPTASGARARRWCWSSDRSSTRS